MITRAKQSGGLPDQHTLSIDDAYDRAFEALAMSPWDPIDDAKDAAKNCGPYLDHRQAMQIIRDWKARAIKDGRRGHGNGRVVLSVFDRSGVMLMPWRLAGFDCYQLDIDTDAGAWPVDVMQITAQFLFNNGLDDVDVLIAQPPCTDFASSGARWFKDKDADGRTDRSIALVKQTLAVVEFLRPLCWCLENPIGRIARLTGLPRPRLRFHPHHYGDPYTKRTQLWGRFNAEIPTANIEPVQGSRIHHLRGDVPWQKKLRSLTPIGFSFAWYMANRNYRHDFESLVAGYCGQGSSNF